MKTAELTPPLLDYWVLRATGWDRSKPFYGEPSAYSTNPAHGQPIIERDRIAVEHGPTEAVHGLPWGDGDREPWHAWVTLQSGRRCPAFGDTPLIAAMRAKVASVFGSEVPDEDTEIPRREMRKP